MLIPFKVLNTHAKSKMKLNLLRKEKKKKSVSFPSGSAQAPGEKSKDKCLEVNWHQLEFSTHSAALLYVSH